MKGRDESTKQPPATTIPQVSHTPDGLNGVAWNVMGQVYIPKEITAERFTWLAVFPEETFVPPHTHEGQDEFLMPLDGEIEVVIGGERSMIRQGEIGYLPRDIPHGFYNNSGKRVNALFWATPAGDLVALYRRLHNVGAASTATSMAPEHGVRFEPPVASGAVSRERPGD